MRRLGILGGTFDPIHIGHLAIAEEARVRLDLPEVRFMPAGQPPHKGGRPITPAAHRLAMVELAIADNPYFSASTYELRQHGPSFTVDTLARLHEELGPDCAIFFIVGGDALADFLTWHRPERVLALATLVVVARPGAAPADMPALEARLPGLRSRLVLLEGPRLELSASELRHRVREALPIRYRVPAAVEAYIRQHGLYRE